MNGEGYGITMYKTGEQFTGEQLRRILAAVDELEDIIEPLTDEEMAEIEAFTPEMMTPEQRDRMMKFLEEMRKEWFENG